MPYAVGTMVEYSRNATSVTTVSAPNFTAVSGDLLICVVMWFNNNTTITLVDSVGTNDSWTRAETGYHVATNNAELYYIQNCAAGSCTIDCTFAGSVNYPSIAIIPVSGIDTTGAFLDVVFNFQTAPGTGTDAVTSTNLATLSTQPALFFGLTLDLSSANTPAAGTGFTSIGAGWTYDGGFPAGMRSEHKRVTVTTADDATFTAGNSADYLSCAAAFKEAAGGPPTPGPTLRTVQSGMRW